MGCVTTTPLALTALLLNSMLRTSGSLLLFPAFIHTVRPSGRVCANIPVIVKLHGPLLFAAAFVGWIAVPVENVSTWVNENSFACKAPDVSLPRIRPSSEM